MTESKEFINALAEKSKSAMSAVLSKETVFQFKYNSDTYEGGAVTISIHRTKKGAEMALDFHKAKQKKHLDDMYVDDPEDKPTLDEYQWWGVEETKILD